MSVRIVYTPRERCLCKAVARTSAARGTIAQCTRCGAYWSYWGGFTNTWHRVNALSVWWRRLLARLAGR